MDLGTWIFCNFFPGAPPQIARFKFLKLSEDSVVSEDTEEDQEQAHLVQVQPPWTWDGKPNRKVADRLELP